MNEEEKQQIFLDTTAYIITCVTAPGVSGVSDVGEGLKHINNLLKVVTAQQAEIAALKAEVKRLTPHWSENPPILVDLK